MRSTCCGLAALTIACGAADFSPLHVVEEAIAPVAIAVHANRTYVVDESGAVVRVEEGERDTIAKIEGDMQTMATSSPAGEGKLSVGADESVWYADPHGTFHAWDGRVWREHDLAPFVGAKTVYNWRVAARTIDDAWAVAYDVSDVLRVHACHYSGGAWACERAPVSEWPRTIAVSPSALWMLGMTDGVVRRRDDRGWSALPSDACIRDIEVLGDEQAYALGCAGGLLFWNGARFAAIDSRTKLFAARTNDDVWLIDEAGTVSHFDGSVTSEVGVVEAPDRVIPVGPGAVEIRGGGVWYAAVTRR